MNSVSTVTKSWLDILKRGRKLFGGGDKRVNLHLPRAIATLAP
jgi:hypothetical protein